MSDDLTIAYVAGCAEGRSARDKEVALLKEEIAALNERICELKRKLRAAGLAGESA